MGSDTMIFVTAMMIILIPIATVVFILGSIPFTEWRKNRKSRGKRVE